MKHILATIVAAGLALGVSVTAGGAAAAGGRHEDDTLERYARDTWTSLDAMTDEATGLPLRPAVGLGGQPSGRLGHAPDSSWREPTTPRSRCGQSRHRRSRS